MNAVLATLLAMTSGTVHNLERPLPELTSPGIFTSGVTGPARYAYDEDGCFTRPSGAIVCRRYGRYSRN